MHGSVIVIADTKALQDGNIYSPWEEYEIKGCIMGCDWVARDEGEEFAQAIESLADIYRLPHIPIEGIKVNGETIQVGVLEPSHIQALKKALDEGLAGRIRMVREEVSKAEPSLWNIAYEAYNFSSVYFILPTDGFFNEVGFAEYLEGTESGIFITETFSFHV